MKSQPSSSARCKKPAEFHAAIAFNARDWEYVPLRTLPQRTHDFVFEFRRVIEHVMRDSQAERNVARIFDVIEAATRMAIVVNGIVVILPHGSADALVALALQQIRRYARIDAAAHRNKHAPLRFRHIYPFFIGSIPPFWLTAGADILPLERHGDFCVLQAAASPSSCVVSTENEKRTAPFASDSETPIARNTWLVFTAPAEQAPPTHTRLVHQAAE